MDQKPDNDDQIDSDDLRKLGDDGPVGLRTGRNPANLGDEVPEEADVTYPEPAPAPAAQM
ncbi:MAG: hypothetical protein ABI797_06840 [Chloroflexota bacterium]